MKLKQTATEREGASGASDPEGAGIERMQLNWTEIMREAGIPEAPGYQEAKEVMRMRMEQAREEVPVKRRSSYRRKSKGKR